VTAFEPLYESVDGLLLVGADDDDDVTDIPIERFRAEPV